MLSGKTPGCGGPGVLGGLGPSGREGVTPQTLGSSERSGVTTTPAGAAAGCVAPPAQATITCPAHPTSYALFSGGPLSLLLTYVNPIMIIKITEPVPADGTTGAKMLTSDSQMQIDQFDNVPVIANNNTFYCRYCLDRLCQQLQVAIKIVTRGLHPIFCRFASHTWFATIGRVYGHYITYAPMKCDANDCWFCTFFEGGFNPYGNGQFDAHAGAMDGYSDDEDISRRVLTDYLEQYGKPYFISHNQLRRRKQPRYQLALQLEQIGFNPLDYGLFGFKNANGSIFHVFFSDEDNVIARLQTIDLIASEFHDVKTLKKATTIPAGYRPERVDPLPKNKNKTKPVIAPKDKKKKEKKTKDKKTETVKHKSLEPDKKCKPVYVAKKTVRDEAPVIVPSSAATEEPKVKVGTRQEPKNQKKRDLIEGAMVAEAQKEQGYADAERELLLTPDGSGSSSSSDSDDEDDDLNLDDNFGFTYNNSIVEHFGQELITRIKMLFCSGLLRFLTPTVSIVLGDKYSICGKLSLALGLYALLPQLKIQDGFTLRGLSIEDEILADRRTDEDKIATLKHMRVRDITYSLTHHVNYYLTFGSFERRLYTQFDKPSVHSMSLEMYNQTCQSRVVTNIYEDDTITHSRVTRQVQALAGVNKNRTETQYGISSAHGTIIAAYHYARSIKQRQLDMDFQHSRFGTAGVYACMDTVTAKSSSLSQLLLRRLQNWFESATAAEISAAACTLVSAFVWLILLRWFPTTLIRQLSWLVSKKDLLLNLLREHLKFVLNFGRSS